MYRFLKTPLNAQYKIPIETTIFDLLKCGPGPSSSHTIAPMKAAYNFITHCNETSLPKKSAKIVVRLFGSLSATGVGHGTHVAIIAGLLGHESQKCPPNILKEIAGNPKQVYTQNIAGHDIPITLSDVIFDKVDHDSIHANIMTFTLIDEHGETLLEREYYSIGGGFIQWNGQEEEQRGKPKYEYGSMAKLQEIISETGLSLPDVLIENEMAITKLSRSEINTKLDEIIELMMQSVERGLNAEGLLPGVLEVSRQAKNLFEKALKSSRQPDKYIMLINAYAFAVSEENADGGVIVTAPTCGAAGVVPSLLYSLKHDMHVGKMALREGLLAAVSIAFLAKHNASIAGAEVGCQGEIGVASSMAAAMLAYVHGHDVDIVANAAEIALEHHLGSTCDPIAGLVQIPCIERCAIASVKAYNAFLLASTRPPQTHKISLDCTINAMNEIGREMSCKFRETALGGLATSYTSC